ncbi:UDP-N-acetylmuramate--alanine ligase [Aerococcus urinaehominis]|uniref:UDP-N-acetylmuramate--L-alanine ligase n=1 Tax=Aerococcus urinaehominis TaxID=128944 RepID=A0A109RGW1_9LACT|nr:UDP-N-acetylmuramate--L-alanine ligase [Aerococcus urinaehominis]AMB99593.1 UDP-N-acetylmuramate--alanine ligase [Aerococcus urinaehominis]SDL86753.1 UDP-N-acetylmuramate--L-alanine ligase [Aerococcus urinaehominis]
MDKDLIYFFIGIKGSGMSALALILHQMGYQVAGSDVADYFFTQKGLDEAGIDIVSFDPDHIQPGMVAIAGNAYKDDHPQIERAKVLGLEVTRYHYFLGNLIKDFTSVAITGSHGKTSTTGLMAHVMSGMANTNYLIGDGTGYGQAGADFFVLEADEYRHHFLAYHPNYAIFTNIDFDHPDFYKDIDQVYAANLNFAKQVKDKVIAFGGDERLRSFRDEGIDVWYYGLEADNEIQARNIIRDVHGSHFDVYIQGEKYGHFDIPSFGKHSVLNALAVIGFCYLEGFSADQVAQELVSFAGVKRRFSEKEIAGTVLIDDYAHHPSEIIATIDAARQKYPDKQLVAVFQPHTYSRTLALLDEFSQALDLADAVFLCDIFASARESDTHIVSIQDLANRVTKPVQVLDGQDFQDLLAYQGQVVLFMGAGDVMKYGNAYADQLTDA